MTEGDFTLALNVTVKAGILQSIVRVNARPDAQRGSSQSDFDSGGYQ
jgi:hypothetical protein